MDKSWFYVKNGKDKRGPIPESELRNLIESGQVLGSDLAWSEDMPDWAACHDLFGEEVAATKGGPSPLISPPSMEKPLIQTVATPLNSPRGAATFAPSTTTSEPDTEPFESYDPPAGLGGWLLFSGMTNIITGVITLLAGILLALLIIPLTYIPVGILLIFAGAACIAARTALFSMGNIDAATHLFLTKIRWYMIIYGILYAFSLVITLFALLMLREHLSA